MLLLVLLSLIVQAIVPGGFCIAAVPFLTELSSLARSLPSGALCSKVKMLPLTMTQTRLDSIDCRLMPGFLFDQFQRVADEYRGHVIRAASAALRLL